MKIVISIFVFVYGVNLESELLQNKFSAFLYSERGVKFKAIAAELRQTVSSMDAIPLYISLCEPSLREYRFTDLMRKHGISNGIRSNPGDLLQ